jgi:hypothetical protein
LGNYQFDKVFSLNEASDLIPTLELLVRDLQSCVKLLRARLVELHGDDPALEELPLGTIVARYPELKGTATRMAAIAQEIESHGCFLKDIDLGLIDFPWAIDDDNVVFLCWQSGEQSVASWHPVEAGFAQRQPLPGVAKQYLN